MREKTMNTKEAYLLQALRLFAEKGYEAVGVVEIAKAVGCTTSALYKHFPGKKALFDAIVEWSKEGFGENIAAMKINFRERLQADGGAAAITEEDQIQMVRDIFLGVVDMEYPRLFRKLITVEQYKHPELAEIYSEHYLWGQIDSFELLMQAWMDAGVMKQGNARIMAMQYVSPIVLFISECDRVPERKAEILALLEDHIRQFNRAYRLQGKQSFPADPVNTH